MTLSLLYFLRRLEDEEGSGTERAQRIVVIDADETRFPKVAFLEMYSAQDGEQRGTRIAALPPLLLSTTSEYAYLFAMVMAGVGDGPDSDRLFLLPNAARRVLEIFSSYKAPHRTDFSEQLRSLVEAEEGSPFRDVYDFCNRYSHGEGSESVDVLDARSVQAQLRRAMEFLKAVDEQHFRRMCQAAKIDKQHLLLRERRVDHSANRRVS